LNTLGYSIPVAKTASDLTAGTPPTRVGSKPVPLNISIVMRDGLTLSLIDTDVTWTERKAVEAIIKSLMRMPPRIDMDTGKCLFLIALATVGILRVEM